MAKSPSVTLTEKDMSTFTVTSSSTVLAVVGYATKGPIGKATKVYSLPSFQEQFGDAVKTTPYSSMAIKRAFKQGNQIVFYRIADDTASVSEVAITNPIAGVKGYQDFVSPGTDFSGLTADTAYSIDITIDGTELSVDLSTAVGQTTYTVANVMQAISLAITGYGSVDLEGDSIRVTTKTIGVSGSVSIDNSSAFIVAANIVVPQVVVNTAVDGTDEITNTTDNILFTSKEKGSSTAKIEIVKSSKINSVTLAKIHNIAILYDGIEKEKYEDISLIPNDENFFKTIMNAEPENGGSKLLSVYVEDNDSNNVITFDDNLDGESYKLGTGTKEFSTGLTVGEYDFRVGTDGVPAIPVDADDLFIGAFNLNGDLANEEEFDYHILITPDNGSIQVQEAAQDLANFRKDFIYVVDPPKGLSFSQVADWHNGKGNGRSIAINTSYASLYWAWLKDYNDASKEYVWVPPSVFIAAKYMEIDRIYGPWYAPAGATRGRLSASDYETSPSFSQREVLYGDFNAVNPIVNFSSKGLLIYGQKTLLRENSALNRVNVRRMLIFIKKLVKAAMDTMLFEPHNPDSWRRATGKIVSILEPIKQANGLDDYKVIIDAKTNTGDKIAQSVMSGIIKLVPTGTIEIIELTLQVNKAGSTLSE